MRTKIVCTIGPSSESEEVLEQLVNEGMSVARLNFSHGSIPEHKIKIDRIKKVREKLQRPVAIMFDTKGPEIRLGNLKDDMEPYLNVDDEYILTTEDITGDEKIASITYKELPKDIKKGDSILIDDGLIELKVESVTGDEIHTKVVNGGFIKSKKGVNVPNVKLRLPSLTEKDVADLKFGVKEDIDFVAASFVRTKEDVLNIRSVLESEGMYNIQIISKIENKEGLENIDDIIEVSDGIMVARGDLGVEIPTEEVPIIQKEIIKKCNLKGKPVITATQMLDSMIRNPRPTRAEANDVANAVLDGSDAIMLSGETASGAYPVEAVKTMAKIARAMEESIDYDELLREKILMNDRNITNSIGKSTCQIAADINADAIITATTSGGTSRAIAKFRPKNQIIAVTTDEKVRRQLSLTWGVEALLSEKIFSTDEVIANAVEISKAHGYVKSSDTVVLTAGVPVGLAGSTNLIKVQTVGELLVRGTGIGEKSVTGRAFVVEEGCDFNEFREGDILVSPYTDKDMIVYIEKAAGLVVEEAGFTSHGAIVGLNLGLPTIVGAKDICNKLKTGDMILINAKSGTVEKQ